MPSNIFSPTLATAVSGVMFLCNIVPNLRSGPPPFSYNPPPPPTKNRLIAGYIVPAVHYFVLSSLHVGQYLKKYNNIVTSSIRETIVTTKLLLRKGSNNYILKVKAITAKPFAFVLLNSPSIF